MSQGAIHRVAGGASLLCRVQTEFGRDIPTVLCAPVAPLADWGPAAPRLHIVFPLDGVPHVIVMTQLVAVSTTDLGPAIGDASDRRDEIVAAVDLLVSGF